VELCGRVMGEVRTKVIHVRGGCIVVGVGASHHVHVGHLRHRVDSGTVFLQHERCGRRGMVVVEVIVCKG